MTRNNKKLEKIKLIINEIAVKKIPLKMTTTTNDWILMTTVYLNTVSAELELIILFAILIVF